MFDQEAHIAAHRIEAGSVATVQDVMARYDDFMNASFGPEFIEEHLGLPIVEWKDPISTKALVAAQSFHPDVTIPGDLRALYTVHGTPKLDDLEIYPAEEVLVSRGRARCASWEDRFKHAPIVFKHAKIIDETYLLVGLLEFDDRTMFLLLDRAGTGFATMLIDDDDEFPEEKQKLAEKSDPSTRLSLVDAVAELVNELMDRCTRMESGSFLAANPDAEF